VNGLLNKTRLYWSLQIGGWTMYVIAQIVLSILLSINQTISLQRVLFFVYEGFLCLLLSHGFRYFIMKWKWMGLDLPRLIPYVLISVFLLAVILYFIRIPISISLNLFNPKVALRTETILSGIITYAIFFFLWSSLYFIYNYFESYNKSLKLEASIKEIELSNLKSQLNPHFIFNALNSIRALVDENPQRARTAITELSNILRSSMQVEKAETVNLENELNIVKDYLALETIRFEERLKVRYEIDPETLELPIPPMMLQTLVENAIKHGISRMVSGGTVVIGSHVKNMHHEITIENTGQIGGQETTGHGFGLQSTRQRLSLLYGNKASFDIYNKNGETVEAKVLMPLF